MSVAVSIALLSPAHGYEISIYSKTPLSYWLGILTAVGLGATVATKSTFARVGSGTVGGILLVSLSTLSVVFLPWLRNYPTYGSADQIFHVREIEHIMDTGICRDTNFYPVLHLLAATYARVSDLSATDIQPLPGFMLVLGLPLVCVQIIRTIGGGGYSVTVAGLLSCVLFYNCLSSLMYPYVMSIILLGFVLWIGLKAAKQRKTIGLLASLIPFLIATPLSHPAGGVILSTAFLVIVLFMHLARYSNAGTRWLFGTVSGLSATMLYLWLCRYPVFDQALVMFRYSLMNPYHFVEQHTLSSVRSELGLLDSILLFLKLYFDTISIIAMALVSWTALVGVEKSSSKFKAVQQYTFLLYLALCGLQLLLFFQGQTNLGRTLNGFNGIVLAIPLSALLVVKLFDSNGKKRRYVPLALALGFILGSYTTAFHSQWVFEAGWMSTESNFEVCEWFEDVRSEDTIVTSVGIEYVLASPEYEVGPHFGYLLGGSTSYHSTPLLVVLGERAVAVSSDRVLSQKSINPIDGFDLTVADFYKLSTDSRVGQILDSGETSICITQWYT